MDVGFWLKFTPSNVLGRPYQQYFVNMIFKLNVHLYSWSPYLIVLFKYTSEYLLVL